MKIYKWLKILYALLFLFPIKNSFCNEFGCYSFNRQEIRLISIEDFDNNLANSIIDNSLVYSSEYFLNFKVNPIENSNSNQITICSDNTPNLKNKVLQIKLLKKDEYILVETDVPLNYELQLKRDVLANLNQRTSDFYLISRRNINFSNSENAPVKNLRLKATNIQAYIAQREGIANLNIKLTTYPTTQSNANITLYFPYAVWKKQNVLIRKFRSIEIDDELKDLLLLNYKIGNTDHISRYKHNEASHFVNNNLLSDFGLGDFFVQMNIDINLDEKGSISCHIL